MKFGAAFGIAFLLLSSFGLSVSGHAAVAARQPEEHPIVKVIALLQKLMADVEALGKTEQVAYQKYVYWCKTTTSELEAAIEEEKKTIAELQDGIAAKEEEEKVLKAQIEALEKQLGDIDASQGEADAIRKDQAKQYAEADGDLDATIAALKEALREMHSAQLTTESKLLFVQRKVRGVLAFLEESASAQQRTALASLVGIMPVDNLTAYGDYQAHIDKYDFKSESVVELLKGLLRMFEDKKLAGTKAETNSLNAYDLSTQALSNEKAATEKAKNGKTSALSGAQRALGKLKGDLKDEEADLAADTTSLQDTQADCENKAREWEERQTTRAGELEAMQKAVEILSKVTGVRHESPENPVPPPAPLDAPTPEPQLPPRPVFLQLEASEDPLRQVVNLIRKAATQTKSKAFARFATEITAHIDEHPFAEVINMIQKMIYRLMDEQKNEDVHKHWCDLEIEKTETMKDDKEAKLKELKASYDVEEAAVQKLTSDIAAAQDKVAEIVAFQAEATEIRKVGKHENALAIKDAQDAQTALANAVAVLRDFYKESGMVPKHPWEFIQQPVVLRAPPSTWNTGYSGIADPKDPQDGIIALLETVASDFARMEAETSTQEEQDQKAYEQVMKDTDIEKARREEEIEMKTNEKKTRIDAMQSIAKEMKLLQHELEQTLQYMKDLEPACINGTSTYEDRKAARSTEIDALKQAEVILSTAFEGNATAIDGPSPAPTGAKSSKPRRSFMQVRAHSH